MITYSIPKTTVMFKAFTVIAFLFVTNFSNAQTTPEEMSPQERSMATMMAEFMDVMWDQEPDAGMCNLRILFLKDGEPFAGEISIHGEFSFKAEDVKMYLTDFSPNANGRWVNEGMDPGNYTIIIKGKKEFPNHKFEYVNFNLVAGESPIIEINL